MGDVGTHHTIYSYVRATMKQVRPDEDYAYIHLGNYLTDLSQVRDTLAYAMGKLKIWHVLRTGDPDDDEGGHWAWSLGQVDVPQYLDELFGEPAKIESSSALAQYLEHLVRLSTSLQFTHKADKDGDLIPEPEMRRIFERNFTRYYPHEHLDFPPWPWADPSPERQADPGSHLLTTLVEQFVYVIESLADVQRDWIDSLRDENDTHYRHNVLADLGHTIHAIEDFFFHTDVLELEHLWRSFRTFTATSNKPQQFWGDKQKTMDFWKTWFVQHALDEVAGEIPAEFAIRARRKYYRRVQDPAKDEKGQLSTTGSTEAYSHVSTGGFGERDIFHTIYGALLALSENAVLQAALQSPRMPIVLLRDLLIENERKKLMDKTYREAEYIKHKAQLDDPKIDQKITEWQLLYGLRDTEVADLKAALEIDRKLTKKYPKAKGIGGFLLGMAAKVQREHEASDNASATLDSSGSVIDGRTLNGASAETIGTHSLLSKDTPKSHPFRGRAVSFASFVSSYVAQTMAVRIGREPGPVDWKPVIVHFLRFPAAAPTAWETQLRLATATADDRLAYDALVDKPEVKMAPLPDPTMRKPLRPRARMILEKKYDDEAMNAWEIWRTQRE